MADMFKLRRAVFPRGQQQEFLNLVLSNVSVAQAAQIGNCSERTIRDWRREKLTMDYRALQKLCRKTGLAMPKDIECLDRYWYVSKGASMGGKMVMKKYGCVGGDPEKRRQRWREWWLREGKFRKNSITAAKRIRKPRYSRELAEYVGILLGDGCLSRWQVAITLNSRDDKEYGEFVSEMIQNLFDVPVRRFKKKNANAHVYYISRVGLVRFCEEQLGLKIGNKVRNQVGVPDWVKKNRSYMIACVRGLIDTDGCIFAHRYSVDSKPYTYTKLSFTSRSKPLQEFVYYTLRELGITCRESRTYDVWIDGANDVKKYMKIIGSSNPKHLKRYGIGVF